MKKSDGRFIYTYMIAKWVVEVKEENIYVDMNAKTVRDFCTAFSLII